MPNEPAIDAWQMELVPAMGQAPHSLSYVKVLKVKKDNKQIYIIGEIQSYLSEH